MHVCINLYVCILFCQIDLLGARSSKIDCSDIKLFKSI